MLQLGFLTTSRFWCFLSPLVHLFLGFIAYSPLCPVFFRHQWPGWSLAPGRAGRVWATAWQEPTARRDTVPRSTTPKGSSHQGGCRGVMKTKGRITRDAPFVGDTLYVSGGLRPRAAHARAGTFLRDCSLGVTHSGAGTPLRDCSLFPGLLLTL